MLSALAAMIFDMDGVVTRTAELHSAAWKTVFDEVLRGWASSHGESFRPFDAGSDYLKYVDGRSRNDGVRHFLGSRGIALPEADAADEASLKSVRGIAARKDALFAQQLRAGGARVYDSSIALVRLLRDRGVRTGIVTSSRHGREVLSRLGIEALFDARLDGIDLDARNLKSKPDPAAFLECARALDVRPVSCALAEDATVGVEAGRRGGFGLVIGIERSGNRQALAAHGAHLVVSDLGELDVDKLEAHLQAQQRAISWRIEQEGFDPAREDEMEGIFTIGNGYLGVRGALESPLPGARDDMFVAGVFDRKQALLPYSEPVFDSPTQGDYDEIVPLPFPFRLALKVGGVELGIHAGVAGTHCRVLSLRRAILESELRFNTNGNRTHVRTRRLASLADLHLLLQEICVELENHSDIVELDGSLADPQLGVRYPHLEPLAAAMVDEDLEILHFRTKASQYEVAIVARMCLTNTGTEGRRWRVRGVIGTRLLFRRFVAVYSSRDGPAPLESARAHLRALRWSDFEPQVAAHEAGWGQLWGSADVRIDGQPAVEQVLHFNAYHLRCAVDHDPRVSIGARTLSGRGYGGHVFWDVEMFMMPFYLHTCPELARELLRYRHRTLAGARERSRAQGYRGACYAWESTVTGADVTPHFVRLASSGRKIPVYTGTQQLHITADIAHAIWRYWEATGDAAFFADCGVEVLIETARFWSSRCTPENGSYHIRGVMGPDEYHCNVSDNAYTNYLVRCNLENADRGVRWLRTEMPRRARELEGELGLTPAEPASWLQIARELYCPAPRSDGVIEQFAGFFNLDPYPPPGVERDAAPVNRLLDAERIDRMQLLKQADVLMLLHLFPEKFSRQTMLANYHYYEPRTDHASSLSPPIHAAIAARLGLHADAERYLQRSLWLDLSDEMSGSASGVHAAGMGGTWQALVFGFLGVRFGQMGVEVDPDAASRLPRGWTSVELELAWRGQRYPVQVRR